MGKTIIKEDAFPEIIDQYNSGGKTAAYDMLRSRYGIKNPYFVIARIKECGKYTYDPDSDRFSGGTTHGSADNIFMNLDELCGTAITKVATKTVEPVVDSRSAEIEKLVHELISDRLLTLSRYITLDSSTRTILIDQTSLSADGYQVVTH